MVKYLQTIQEEEEHDQEGNHNYDLMRMVSPGGSPGVKRKSQRGIRGSFIGDNLAETAPAPETEEQKAEREKKEVKDNFKVLSKEDSKLEMKKKDFDDFLVRTGRIVERALDTDFDIIGDFFTEDDEDQANIMKQKGDKITQQFVF